MFGQQISRHIGFGTAQHERGDAFAQLLQSLVVAQLLNGSAKQVLEAGLAAQKPGHQEVKQAPQLAQVVFHGCAGQAQAVPGAQLTHHLRGIGIGVFDVLGLVQHHDVPGLLQPALAVALQQRIRCNDQVVLRHIDRRFVAVSPMQHQHFEIGGEAVGFAPPVAHQAHRGNHQRGAIQPTGLFLHQDVGEGLQSFAQAHVIRQDAGQAMGAQKLQPVQTLLLIGAQLGMQAWRQEHFGQSAVAAELLDHLAQAVSPSPLHALAQRRTHAQGLQPGQAQGVARQVMAALPHQVQQGLQPRAQGLGGQSQKRAVRLLQVNVVRKLRGTVVILREAPQLVQQLRQKRQDVVPLVVDLHTQ